MALVTGGGIWAMHFIGMLASRMDMPVGYGVGGTVLSFLVAVVATGAGFVWVIHPRARPGGCAAGRRVDGRPPDTVSLAQSRRSPSA